jgi:hypothetical protein
MDLADFPHLKELNLDETAVGGDIRDIRDIDFPKLEQLTLPMTIYGGLGYELQRISDGPDLIRTLYLFKQHRPTILMPRWYAVLSDESPDWYYHDFVDETPPFFIQFVEAGSRVGYRWIDSDFVNPCEVNWLDPEPGRGTRDYENYIKRSKEIEREVNMYRGFHQPPTENEYDELCDEYNRFSEECYGEDESSSPGFHSDVEYEEENYNEEVSIFSGQEYYRYE